MGKERLVRRVLLVTTLVAITAAGVATVAAGAVRPAAPAGHVHSLADDGVLNSRN